MVVICDTCGKQIVDDDARYSLADKPEEGLGRHWDCHTPMDVNLKRLRSTLDDLDKKIDETKRRL